MTVAVIYSDYLLSNKIIIFYQTKIIESNSLHRICVLVSILYKRINFEGSLIVAFEDVVFIPSKLWYVFDSLSNVSEALRLALGAIVEALDGFHVEFGHQSAQNYSKYIRLLPVIEF